jgi:hypothetical protein
VRLGFALFAEAGAQVERRVGRVKTARTAVGSEEMREMVLVLMLVRARVYVQVAVVG